jgi:NAD+ synthetase
MKIALIQLNPVVGAVSANAARLAESVRRAAALGADLCLAPEMALLGYPPRDLLLCRDMVDAGWRAVEELAGTLADAPPLLLGAVAPAPDGASLRNRAAFLRRGLVEAAYDKRLLPTYDVFDESRYFTPGDGPVLVEVCGIRFGLSVCEDVWSDAKYAPEAARYGCDPCAELAAAGAEAVLNISASPFRMGKQRLRQDLLASLARRHARPFFYANQVGANDELIFDGRSTAFAPDGSLAARGRSFEEDLVLVSAECTPGGTWTLSGPVAEDDFTEESEAWRAMVLGVRDYCRKCGFTSALLGLSGGVDSSLVAAVAAEALGPANVTGVLMPSPYSSRGSVDDALTLAANLSIATLTLPIAGLMESFDAALSGPFAGRHRDVTEENIQSRIRGNLLMALSNKLGAILLTTGNKSELAVGYCTIYGDMSGGLAVISDLPKTLVYRVCSWLNAARGAVIPEAVMTKAPSAELAPGQKDQDSLPPYEVLDPILARLIEQGASPAQVAREGFDPATVDKVWRLVRISEFKRRQAAPGLKITSRAFGMGWRMPLACRPDLPAGNPAKTGGGR